MASTLTPFYENLGDNYYRLIATQSYVSDARSTSSSFTYSDYDAFGDYGNHKGMVLIAWDILYNADNNFYADVPTITIDSTNIALPEGGRIYISGNQFINGQIMLPFRSGYNIQMTYPKSPTYAAVARYGITTWKLIEN